MLGYILSFIDIRYLRYELRSASISEEWYPLHFKDLREWYLTKITYIRLPHVVILVTSLIVLGLILNYYLFSKGKDHDLPDADHPFGNFNNDTEIHSDTMIKHDDSYQLVFLERDRKARYAVDIDKVSFLLIDAIFENYNEIKSGKLPTFPTDFPCLSRIINGEAEARFLKREEILMEGWCNESLPEGRILEFSKDIDGKGIGRLNLSYLENSRVAIADGGNITDRIDTTMLTKHLNWVLRKFQAWKGIIFPSSDYEDRNRDSMDTLNNMYDFFIRINRFVLGEVREYGLILHLPGSDDPKECLVTSLEAENIRLLGRLIGEWNGKVARESSFQWLKNRYDDERISGQWYSHLWPARKMFTLEKNRKDPMTFEMKYLGEGRGDLTHDHICARTEMAWIVNEFESRGRTKGFRYLRDEGNLSLILNGRDDKGTNYLRKVVYAHYTREIIPTLKLERLRVDLDDEVNGRILSRCASGKVWDLEFDDGKDDGKHDYEYTGNWRIDTDTSYDTLSHEDSEEECNGYDENPLGIPKDDHDHVTNPDPKDNELSDEDDNGHGTAGIGGKSKHRYNQTSITPMILDGLENDHEDIS